MTFSKFRYAIASLLLIGASSLLVSCVDTKPSAEPEKLSASIAGCEIEELKDETVPVTPKKTSKKPKKAPAKDYADCIATE